MHELLISLLTLMPLDATPGAIGSAVQQPVSPGNQGNGFAAYIVGGFFGLGLLVVAMVLITLKPKRADPRQIPPPRPRPQ